MSKGVSLTTWMDTISFSSDNPRQRPKQRLVSFLSNTIYSWTPYTRFNYFDSFSWRYFYIRISTNVGIENQIITSRCLHLEFRKNEVVLSSFNWRSIHSLWRTVSMGSESLSGDDIVFWIEHYTVHDNKYISFFRNTIFSE